MNIGSVDSLPAERLHSAGVYRDICFPNGSQHPPGIDSCTLERGVAMDGADAQKIQVRMMGREEDSKSILCFGSAS